MMIAHDLSLYRGQHCILTNINLKLRPGQVISLLGPNGAGKSTLLAALAGDSSLIHSGKICLNGQSYQQLSQQQLAQQRAVLPQQPTLGFNLHVNDVIAMGAYPFMEIDPKTVSQLQEQVIALAHIEHLVEGRYLQLSGGEQQRVQLARVLLQLLAAIHSRPSPVYLLLDEPTASLDPQHQQHLLRCVSELSKQYPIGVLAVLHDINLAALWSDELLLIAQGKTVALGSPTQVLTSENLYAVYQVQAQVRPHPQHTNKPLVIFS